MKPTAPKFFALIKNFTTGKLEPIDVLEIVALELLEKYRPRYNRITILDEDAVYEDLVLELKYRYHSKCECEYIAIDWPFRDDSIVNNRPIKLDVWAQIEPNIDLIFTLVWDYLYKSIMK